MTPHVILAPEATSVPAARRFVRTSLVELGAATAADDAEALVSELATNAVLHARTRFTIEVHRDGSTVRVCVLDESPTRPQLRDYGAEATTGRGMGLIASLASDWGVEAQHPGKVVWFELRVSGSTVEAPSWDEEDLGVDALLAGSGDDEGDRDGSAMGMAA